MLGFFHEDMLAGIEGLRRKAWPEFPSNEQ
jgi:hypothetical protein